MHIVIPVAMVADSKSKVFCNKKAIGGVNAPPIAFLLSDNQYV